MRNFLHVFLMASLGLFYACGPDTPVEMTDPTGALPDSLDKAASVKLPPGFVAEHLYCPTDSTIDQGSWVSMAVDDKGNLYASDQSGGLYYLTISASEQDSPRVQVDSLPLDIGRAHGLLWAFNSLYVMVNTPEGRENYESGLYRILDSDQDGQLDQVHLLRRLYGNGEHGPHNIVMGPDQRSLYLISGNYTELPEPFDSRLTTNWEEDNLLPIIKDPRGHANKLKPPGAWIARTDPWGREWELVSSGYRNPFDLAFNQDGELFTFDADMEWDMGMPWYRPTRVCHATSGSQFGWRTGSGKWPEYYPDALPPVVNVGQGSPTGILMGHELAFPSHYRDGLFIADWSFGTVYFVKLSPSGSSYEGVKEEFLSAVPFPIADMVAGKDGSLFLLSGGRGLGSDLYRVRYVGNESTDLPQSSDVLALEARATRYGLEALHQASRPEAVASIWPYLADSDRFIRYSALIALEHQPVRHWLDSLRKENDPVTLTQAVIALAHQGNASHRSLAYQALAKLDLPVLTPQAQIDAMRAFGLVSMRLGRPAAATRQAWISTLHELFPNQDARLNREMSFLLAYLDDPQLVPILLALLDTASHETPVRNASLISEEITERSEQYGPQIRAMYANMPNATQLNYVHALSETRSGWTEEFYRQYFTWFYKVQQSSGGMSFQGFLDRMRQNAFERMPKAYQASLATLAGSFSQPRTRALADLPKPRGPGRTWTKRMVEEIFWDDYDAENFRAPSYAQGKKMFAAALCETCHRVAAQGGNIGPDLTQVMNRFDMGGLLHTIFSPSQDISDQYAASFFRLKDGSTLVGRILSESDTEIVINPNPFVPEQTQAFAPNEVADRSLSPVSPMPPGLLDRLNPEEVRDLLYFLRAQGNPQDSVYVGVRPE